MEAHEVRALLEAVSRATGRLTERPAVRSLSATLDGIVAGAVEAVPGARFAGLTVMDADGRLSSSAPSAEVVAHLDGAQAAMHEGPCVRAVELMVPGDTEPGWDAATVRVDDMAVDAAQDGRWPRFAAEALRRGIVSMLSTPLVGDRRGRIALNLYADRVGVFDAVARTIARVFADQAAIAIHGAEQVESLQKAVTSRDVIGQAKGILIERHRVDDSRAFAMLVRASQDSNIKVVEVARSLVDQTVDGGAEAPSLAADLG